MIHHNRIQDALFRQTARGREPLATPNEGGSHVHYQSMKRVGVGCITSRPAGKPKPLTFYEMLAIRLGVDVATARRLHLADKVK